MKTMKNSKRIVKKREIPARWYEVFGMGGALPADFSESDNLNVLRIPKHYFMKF